MTDETLQLATIQRLADEIKGRGFATPVRLMLDVVSPLDIVSAQIALFISPFTIGSRFYGYSHCLSHERAWKELRRILARYEC
jgi:hypothetical protein